MINWAHLHKDNALQRNATHRNAPQRTAAHHSPANVQEDSSVQSQHTARHRKTLQNTATHRTSQRLITGLIRTIRLARSQYDGSARFSIMASY
jgi:hypothetical protein